MQEHTLIANSGIQIITFPLRINTQEKFKMWYHEWYDTENGEWRLDPVYELRTDDECYYYNKQKLHKGGYLSDPTIEIDVNELKSDDILPLRIEDENCPGVRGDIFSLTFSDKDNKFSLLETTRFTYFSSAFALFTTAVFLTIALQWTTLIMATKLSVVQCACMSATSMRQLTLLKAKEVAVAIPRIGDVRRTKMR